MSALEFSNKQRRFICYYVGVSQGNATDAARRAGYAFPDVAGPRLLRIARIRAATEAKVTEIALSADEVLSRLADHATLNLSEFYKIDKQKRMKFDFAGAKKAGKFHLIKRIKKNREGDWEPEFHDAQAALALLAKYHNLLNDRQPIPEQPNPFPDLIDVRDVTRNGSTNGHK